MKNIDPIFLNKQTKLSVVVHLGVVVHPSFPSTWRQRQEH